MTTGDSTTEGDSAVGGAPLARATIEMGATGTSTTVETNTAAEAKADRAIAVAIDHRASLAVPPVVAFDAEPISYAFPRQELIPPLCSQKTSYSQQT